VNLAQDLSPGTAFRVNGLVPEARLSPAQETDSLPLLLAFTQTRDPPGCAKTPY
jgi:hypothetical protein